MERFPDPIDAAQEQQQRSNDAALDLARARAAPETDPDFDGKHCIEPDCGMVIPLPRRILGKIRCITCQEVFERQQRR